MENKDTQIITKIMELTQELKQEVEKAKINFDDTEGFDLNKYLDNLFDQKYNYLEDADVNEEMEDVETYLSSCSTKDLIISVITALCASQVISIGDIVVALDVLKQKK